MELLTILLLYILVFILSFLLFNFRWIVKTVRSISHPKNQGGYTKLIQIGLITLLSGIFILIIIYYIFNHDKVDRIDVILTVIVGWLGAIIGRFFGERAMESLEEKRQTHVEKLNLIIDKYNLIIDKLKKK